MRTVWGFGIFRIGTDSSNYATFSTRQGKITFVEEFNEYTTLSGSFRRISKGWRPMIEVRLYNTCATDWQNIVELFDHINQVKPGDLPLWVQPRYDSDLGAEVLAYDCELVSDIGLVDIAEVEAGQYIDLVFRGRERVTSIPTNASDPTLDQWTDEDNDQYVDESGNTYQLKS